jgi:triosephosphate isomerase
MPFVGGNWKMNTDLASGVELADDIVAGGDALVTACDIAVCPPFPYLQAVGRTLGHHGILLGAQDVWPGPDGAYTGEVSTAMLADLNVAAVIVGHSERRHVIGEDDELINRKALAVREAGLTLILCVGETEIQRVDGVTDEVIVDQLRAGLDELDIEPKSSVVIAYEPVWAIGTGHTASPEDAQAAHRVLRHALAELYDEETATGVRIIYGGSVKAQNAAELFSQRDIDGGLIGGASLSADDFVSICRAAVEAAALEAA